jgi:hypothetical protein
VRLPFGLCFFRRFDFSQMNYRALRWRSHLYYLTGFIMTVKNGLYSIRIEMKDGIRGRATGVLVLLDGQILGVTRISITQVPIPSKTASGAVN